METLGINCAYHADKSAIALCRNCRKPICELDVNKTSDYNYTEYTINTQIYDFCFFCYRDKQQNQQTLSIFGIFIFMFSTPFFIARFIQPLNFLGILSAVVIGGFLILVGIYSYRKATRNITAARKRYSSEPATHSAWISKNNVPVMQGKEIQNFFNQGNDVATSKEIVTANICRFCGYTLSSNDVFCSNCGKNRS